MTRRWTGRESDRNLIDLHTQHHVAECPNLIGNPGVGDKFDTLTEGEQDRLQGLVSSIRIHLAILEESGKNQSKMIKDMRSDLSRDILRLEAKIVEVDSTSRACLAEVKKKQSTILSSISSLKTMQKIIWGILSGLTLLALGEIVSLLFFVLRTVIQSGVVK